MGRQPDAEYLPGLHEGARLLTYYSVIDCGLEFAHERVRIAPAPDGYRVESTYFWNGSDMKPRAIRWDVDSDWNPRKLLVDTSSGYKMSATFSPDCCDWWAGNRESGRLSRVTGDRSCMTALFRNRLNAPVQLAQRLHRTPGNQMIFSVIPKGSCVANRSDRTEYSISVDIGGMDDLIWLRTDEQGLLMECSSTRQGVKVALESQEAI